MTDRLILVPDALDIAIAVAQEKGLAPAHEEMLRMMSVSCDPVPTISGDAFRLRDLEGFVKNISQALKYKDSSYLRQPRGLCVEKIVGVEEFVNSREYMNQQASCRTAVLDGLIELFDSPRSIDYIECTLSGSTGWGKSFFSYLAIAYMVYKLSCQHNPQLEYDLAPGTSIIFIFQSKRYELSKKVLFEQLTEMLKLSPYFMRIFPFDPEVKSELRFPKGIYVLPVGGSDTAALGMNVFGGAIDEMNYMARVRYSERFESSMDTSHEYDQAEQTYRTLIRRMKGRFMQHGRLPGKLLLISSRNYTGDFTDRKAKEAEQEMRERGKSSILVLTHSQWEVLPQDRFSGEKFLVELGSNVRQSRIVDKKDEAEDPDSVLEVPVEYKSDFDRDINAALKDYAGFTTGSLRPFIPYPDLIARAQESYREVNGERSLFKKQEVVIDSIVDPESPDWENLVDMEYIHQCIADPAAVFATHIDLAASEDAAGLAVGRLYGYKILPSTKYFDPNMKEFVEVKDLRAPIYMIDGVLGILPPPSGRQIDFDLVKQLILWLKGHIYIKWATMDLYQSVMMIQAFRKAKIRSGVLSVDETIVPYTEVKLAIKDERILLPPHVILAKELKEVEKDPKRDKINHPATGSKDRADAVAGVVTMLQRKEAFYGRTGRRSARNVIVEEVQTPSMLPSESVRAIKVHRGISTGRRSRIL